MKKILIFCEEKKYWFTGLFLLVIVRFVNNLYLLSNEKNLPALLGSDSLEGKNVSVDYELHATPA